MVNYRKKQGLYKILRKTQNQTFLTSLTCRGCDLEHPTSRMRGGGSNRLHHQHRIIQLLPLVYRTNSFERLTNSK